MAVVATGSVAFDYILTFKGHFGDQIVADKTHVINLSFLVDSMEKHRGGVAANYAYTLALLGHPAAMLATAGSDAGEYRAWLESMGIDCRGLRLLPDVFTATGFTTTDLNDNQITGYYGGAMLRAGMLGDLGVERAARIASLAATYVVEQTGTMEHRYTRGEFAARFRETYGEDPW